MNIEQMLNTLTPEIVAKLKTAVEIGKWDNGVALTKEQRVTCMQAVLVWEHKHLPEAERTGYIDRGLKKKMSIVIHTIQKMMKSLLQFVLPKPSLPQF